MLPFLKNLGKQNFVRPSGGTLCSFLLAAMFVTCFVYLDYGGLIVNYSLPKPKEAAESSDESCDLYDGKWVSADGYPLYSSASCPFMDSGFRCLENGRADSLYTKWRWRPNRCELPRFDARKMLRLLRNRRIAFVGDSVGRNQWESLLCMLASGVANKSSIYEANGAPITKHKGYLVFVFEEFNSKVEYYRSPFLMYTGHPPTGSPKDVKTTLRLDSVDWSARLWKDADFLVFNTGHWWNYDKTIRWGCYFQEGKEVRTDMSVEAAYRKAIETLIGWIGQNINATKTHVFFRSYAPSHYTDGDWNTNGSCHGVRWPHLGESKAFSDFHLSALLEALSSNGGGSGIDLLNVTAMSSKRNDGHPSIYYLEPKDGPAPMNRQDCSHWCLPGVPDSWNEILYARILKKETNG